MRVLILWLKTCPRGVDMKDKGFSERNMEESSQSETKQNVRGAR